MKGGDIGTGERGASKETSLKESTVGVLKVGSRPIEGGGDRARAGGGGMNGEAAGDKADGGLSGVELGK